MCLYMSQPSQNQIRKSTAMFSKLSEQNSISWWISVVVFPVSYIDSSHERCFYAHSNRLATLAFPDLRDLPAYRDMFRSGQAKCFLWFLILLGTWGFKSFSLSCQQFLSKLSSDTIKDENCQMTLLWNTGIISNRVQIYARIAHMVECSKKSICWIGLMSHLSLA